MIELIICDDVMSLNQTKQFLTDMMYLRNEGIEIPISRRRQREVSAMISDYWRYHS